MRRAMEMEPRALSLTEGRGERDFVPVGDGSAVKSNQAGKVRHAGSGKPLPLAGNDTHCGDHGEEPGAQMPDVGDLVRFKKPDRALMQRS